MINLEVYTKEKPNVTQRLAREWGIELVEDIDEIKGRITHQYRDYRRIYRWSPRLWDVREARPYINIEVEQLKSRWSTWDEEAARQLTAAKRKGLLIPQRYIERVRSDDGTVADAKTYRFLQRYPDLEKVSRLEPLWGILRSTRGRQSYHVSLETPIWTSEEAVIKMCQLAQDFAGRFSGIVWGEGQFGLHNPHKLYQTYSRVNEGVTGFLGQFFDLQPAEPSSQ